MRKIKVKAVKCILCNSDDYGVLAKGKDFEYHTCSNIFNIVRCAACGHVYLNPKPIAAELKTIYPDNYYSYHFPESKFSLARLGKELIEKKYVKLYKGLIGERGAILDVGSGDGRLLGLLKRGNKEWNLAGVDFNREANEIARRKGLRIYEGMFEKASLPQKSFDLVIMNEVIEHVSDVQQMLKRAKKILKPGGYLTIETPCLYAPDHKLFIKSYWGGYHIPRHFNIFSRETIEKVLKKHGFKIIKIESLLSPPFWILSIHNLLDDKHLPRTITRFFNFYNPLLLAVFTLVDALQMMTGRITSTMRVVAKDE